MSWPWMKDQPVAIADPIEVAEDDERPAVKDLIEQHRGKIDEMKEKLQEEPLYEPSKHDDLWVVRFLLSHKKVKPALKAAKHTLVFRKEHNLDDRDVRPGHMGFDDEAIPPSAMNYYRCCRDDTFRFVIHKKCVVNYVQWAGLDQPRLLKEVSPDDWLPTFAFITEYSFQWADFLTRTTGRLTKAVRIIDLKDCSIIKNGQPKAAYRDSKALNQMEDVYPQMLHALYLVEAPFWIEGPWKGIRPLVPKRVLQKFDFLEPSKNEKDRNKMLKLMDVSRLPSRYGGQMPHWPDNTPPPTTQ